MAILETQDVQLAGSFTNKYNLNSTSYSGADIKLLVHTYNPADARRTLDDTIDNELKIAQTKLDETEGQIAKYQDKLANAIQGTQEINKYRNILNKLEKDRKHFKDTADVLLLQGINNADTNNSPFGAVKVIAEAQTISISSHRGKQFVRAIGHSYPKGVTRGSRSISGSMVFTVFNKHVFEELMEIHPSDFDGAKYTSAITDQLPPMDITIAFANEYGNVSRMAIYGVEFFTEGMVLSIEDIMTETTMNFLARDFDPIRGVKQRKIDEQYRLQNQWVNKTASDLIFEEDYHEDESMMNPFQRYSKRNNPFF